MGTNTIEECPCHYLILMLLFHQIMKDIRRNLILLEGSLKLLPVLLPESLILMAVNVEILVIDINHLTIEKYMIIIQMMVLKDTSMLRRKIIWTLTVPLRDHRVGIQLILVYKLKNASYL